VRDFDTAQRDDAPPKGTDVVWHCFVQAEPTLFERLFTRVDVEPALGKLDADLRAVLSHESRIKVAPAP
jgi:hypothetical protein